MTTQATRTLPGRSGPPANRSALKRVAVPVTLIIVGLLVLLYPVVATQWNNAKQARVAQQYSELEEQTPPEQLSATLERARQYNAGRVSGAILDPWLNRISEDNAEYQDYLRELADQEVMARVVVPAADADLPVYHGTSDAVLQRGVGHLYGTDLPVGGDGTHSVLTAHTGLSNATMFDNLNKVEAGDVFYIAVSGEKLKYEVESVETVLPHETDGLRVQENRDLMTLVTCAPYGINTHRLLVTGHRVPMDPADEAAFEGGGPAWQWWMWAIVAASVAVVGALAVWLRNLMRREAGTTATGAAGTGAGTVNEGPATGDHHGMNDDEPAYGGDGAPSDYDGHGADDDYGRGDYGRDEGNLR